MVCVHYVWFINFIIANWFGRRLLLEAVLWMKNEIKSFTMLPKHAQLLADFLRTAFLSPYFL